MRVRIPLAILGCFLLAACVRIQPRQIAFEQTQEPVTRLVAAEPAVILTAGAATLREMGFEVIEAGADMNWVFSNPIVIQSTWRGDPVSDRILCGVATAIDYDPDRVGRVSNTLPVELSLGFEVERLATTTATRILFLAQGRRATFEFQTTPTMSCTVTHDFVDEIFVRLRANLPRVER